MNKIDENGEYSEITQEDVNKFNDMRELIGMCIENTSQISNTINVTLKINETMNKISGLMGNEE